MAELQPTKLAYFDNMWQLQASAKVLAVTMEAERFAVILDHTIVYPQGGGQPSDKASILSLDKEVRFQVDDARLKNGIVYHYGFFETSESMFKVGQEVILLVDQPRRELHSRLHTAGHLLDVCMRNVRLDSLKPGKGSHSPDGAFVEYIGAIPASDIELKRAALEEEINRLVASGGPVHVAVLPYEDAAGLCGGSLPEYISKDSSPRIVRIGNNLGCPCGGTHVKDISVLGNIKVTQIRVKKGVTKITYSLNS